MSQSYWRGARHSSRLLLCFMLILALMALTACGSIAAPVFSATPSGSGPAVADRAEPASLLLCANPASATRVAISRSSMPRQIQPEHTLPPVQAVITTPDGVRALAKALCALPLMRAGAIRCPSMFVGIYTLSFTADGRLLPVVTVRESGCEPVTGLGPARSAGTSREFWTVLAGTLAIASPVRPIFGDNPPHWCQVITGNAPGGIMCPQKQLPAGHHMGR